MTLWRDVPIGDVLTLQRGFDITRESQSEGSVPVISSGGVSSYHDTSMADGPGVVIGRKGTLGKAFYSEGPYWPHDTTLWVRDFKGSEPKFVYYFFKNLDISFLDVGSANPTLNRNHVHPIVTRWPDAGSQRAIAQVLSALDDKIAVNARVSKAALDLASLRFDRAREQALVTVTHYEAVADVAGGGTPSTKVPEYWGGDIPWVTPTDVTALAVPYLDRTSRTITQEGFAACSSAMHPRGSILMTSRATIGAFALVSVPVTVNQGFLVVNAKDPKHQWWLFHEMQTRVGDYLAHANGATFLELSRGRFKTMDLAVPTDPIVFEQLAAEVEPLHDRARQTSQESRMLADLRDTLLPNLMSGRISVRQAESVVSEAL